MIRFYKTNNSRKAEEMFKKEHGYFSYVLVVPVYNGFVVKGVDPIEV